MIYLICPPDDLDHDLSVICPLDDLDHDLVDLPDKTALFICFVSTCGRNRVVNCVTVIPGKNAGLDRHLVVLFVRARGWNNDARLDAPYEAAGAVPLMSSKVVGKARYLSLSLIHI